LPLAGDAVRKGLERLTRKRLICSPARGVYVVVPPQFRRQGTVPATHFIDAMMQALGRHYYVSLVSAAGRLARGGFRIAGVGFKQTSATAYRFEATIDPC
jgi:hypothetical protein